MLATRFFLPLAHHNVAQDLVLTGYLGDFIGVRTGQLRFLVDWKCLQLAAQRSHLDFKVFVLALACLQLRAKILQSLPRVNHSCSFFGLSS